MQLIDKISQWKQELLTPNSADVLVNLSPGKNALEVEPISTPEQGVQIKKNKLISKLYDENRKSIRDSGTPIFGICHQLLSFEINGVSYNSPLQIASCDLSFNRLNQAYTITQLEPFYFNPFLVKLLQFDERKSNDEVLTDLKENGLHFQMSEINWCANFHPHRFILVKELETIEGLDHFAQPIRSIIDNENDEDCELKLHDGELFTADFDQQRVFEQVKKENTVVQGPPGTGKSQVISNLLGKTLASTYQGLLIAEKKVALDVIYERLKEKDLHHFCLLHHHQVNPKEFISSIKNTWSLLEKRNRTNKPYQLTSKLKMDGLSLTLERLRQPDLIGGISFSSFLHDTKNCSTDQAYFFTQLPSISQWKAEKDSLSLLIKTFGKKDKSWTFLKQNVVTEPIKSLEKDLIRINTLIQSMRDPSIKKVDLDEMSRKSGLAALFFYDDSLIDPKLFNVNDQKHKKFGRLYNKLIKYVEEVERLKAEKKHWNKQFSLSELNEYIKVLSSTSPFDLKSKFLRKKLLKFTDLNLKDAAKTLENLVQLKEAEKKLNDTRDQLRKIGIQPEIEQLNHINFVLKRLNQYDENLLKQIIALEPFKINELRQKSKNLNTLNSLIRKYLIIDDETIIYDVVEQLLNNLEQLARQCEHIKQVSDETKLIWRSCDTEEQVKSSIYHSHWRIFEGRFPQLAKLDSSAFQARIEEIIQLKHQEEEDLSELIKDHIQHKFDEMHKLLQTPAQKLDQRSKQLKKEIRKGKSILVKAFAKSRNLPSIYDLLNSEANHWIKVLHPLFLCSPFTVAKSIPIHKKFDLVIFDEASQIPLPHALGGLQRGKRIVVAGDPEQMAPSFLFQKKANRTHDLLHQASFYWRSRVLTNHYRSAHEKLIAFSNRYFYKNELTPYPVPGFKIPIDVINVEGKYVDRKNSIEAKKAAEIIHTLAKNKKNIGVVAFSKSQLDHILAELPTNSLDYLNEENLGFVQSLENVQGDQCDHLVISLGYAKNDEGQFHMRFGPLNEEQGHRRLNVLMSRARKKITFIRSVNADDFTISDNNGVEMLRKLMLFLEEDQDDVTHLFPPGISADGNELLIVAPQTIFSQVTSLVNYYSVMIERGWKIKTEF